MIQTLIVIGIVTGLLLIAILVYVFKWVRHAWDIDETSWMKVRDKILADPDDDYESPTASGVHTRYAGVAYSAMTSMSPVTVLHRKPLEKKIRHKIERLFPPWIRIEFQEVGFKGEQAVLYGRGNLLREPVNVSITPTITRVVKGLEEGDK